jgi:hypothetical protein
MKLDAIRGAHGVVIEVADPEAQARLWRRALGLPVLRRRRGEVVLGSLAFFVVLRRSSKREARVAELHVAVEGLAGRGLEKDDLGGWHATQDLGGLRLVIRELTDPPSRAWLARRRRGRK